MVSGPYRGNFRFAYYRAALGPVDRRTQLQQSVRDALYGSDSIDTGRVVNLLELSHGDTILDDMRADTWLLLLGLRPSHRPLWDFVAAQQRQRYEDLLEVSPALAPSGSTVISPVECAIHVHHVVDCVVAVDRRAIVFKAAILSMLLSIFPNEEDASVFFMYLALSGNHAMLPRGLAYATRNGNVTGVTLDDDVTGPVLAATAVYDPDMGRCLAGDPNLVRVLSSWVLSLFVIAGLSGSLLPVWERVFLLRHGQGFLVAFSVALLHSARDAILTSSDVVYGSSLLRDNPAGEVFAKALEIELILLQRSRSASIEA
uniref:Rab-GAP TBC domain-containing protein n=1 Tax=Spongospora subterranea TaxID=70186 RepID=A0A0H5QY11_9EUKA|eukprot:CRZ06627.1 hypothetical protein [Spongospora subterranea]